MNNIQSIRGMHDILPDKTPMWRWLEGRLARVFAAYDFHEIRLPILEKAEVFSRAIGQATDVVEKEMYAFEDRNGELLSLRPEGTAAVVRSAIQHGLLHSPGLKVWYQGAMFRHERPQKGRQRQFHQFGAEVFGLEQPTADVELIALGERLWRELGLSGRIRLEINTLGDREDRQRYRQKLVEYLTPLRDRLDTDSQRRLDTNPLRIFDSKNEETRAIMADAPRLADELGDAAREHFRNVCSLLDRLGIEYSVNTGLVRGLDYYCRTVFEWVTDDLGAQGTVCAGGRYNDLVAIQGGRDTPGIGFALGVERLLAMLEAAGVEHVQNADVFLVSQVDAGDMLSLAEKLRDDLPGLSLATALAGGSMRSQFKRADRSGARWCVILGEAEFARGEAAIKDLRGDADQEVVALEQLPQRLQSLIAAQRDD
ncbi:MULTISPECIES: histidine--tRNA ligase [unclassified Wenzhouxiangella]|uniref:histidine--tRNA ligase n=1 Tax=unclassified Wenzhouxiangella TaxID=2613841 RepID=UPI000E3254B5|nr:MULTISPECIES: histidine--tRNA ligase [unclassified Wenzhouxiangella]RFF27968.1 histidine--tRNA ligase [Wenzhouxiangella sp. 15181]RFP68555.1 histidine--tRNA ligase [Wenzhouxiangella sp. 15190]